MHFSSSMEKVRQYTRTQTRITCLLRRRYSINKRHIPVIQSSLDESVEEKHNHVKLSKCHFPSYQLLIKVLTFNSSYIYQLPRYGLMIEFNTRPRTK